eukprot:CAMPEP_0178735454 /NCGR_PEP_ID=MMETSP0744-20121128/1895_1 /TAXON_ID=913974 /ORGANISM="Nitzschia punctata, Strain CCMP561" /LENGTH=386 /DNA_ID=CAMNT_0020387821 /DNA_START=450 /DNA_END=1607 /DNA_ORIENTATION=-
MNEKETKYSLLHPLLDWQVEMSSYLEDAESEALAHGIALSENEWIQEKERNERASERTAWEYHRDETCWADQEYARAVESSEKQHTLDTTTWKMNQVLNEQRVQVCSDANVGSWDCIQCTFTNDPYRKSCAVCKASAPPQILTYAPMSTLRFGLEIEFIVPNGKRDGFTYEWLEREWNSVSDNTIPRVMFLGYSHDTIEHWKIAPDSSLHGNSPGDLCLELVSPILQGEDGLKQLRRVMDRLRSLGIATNNSCGFHVHVDASRGSGQALPAMSTLFGVKKISRSFLALENAFDLLVGLSWERMDYQRRANQNRYCQSNRVALGELSNRQRWERITNTLNFTHLVTLVSPDRYRKLNLTNIINRNRNSTIEFRNHGGVEDLLEAEAW